jgi:phage terminase small subunit
VVTQESLVAEAEEIRIAAFRDGQFAAALAAVKEKGVLTGVRVERNEQGSPGEFADLENVTADELKAFVAKTAAELLH